MGKVAVSYRSDSHNKGFKSVKWGNVVSSTSVEDDLQVLPRTLQFYGCSRIILGKITTSDGPTNAYTVIRGRWVAIASGSSELVTLFAAFHLKAQESSFISKRFDSKLNFSILYTGFVPKNMLFYIERAQIRWKKLIIRKQNIRSLPNGKRGEVYEVMGDRVALLLDISENSTDEGEKDEKPTGEAAEPLLYFVQEKLLLTAYVVVGLVKLAKFCYPPPFPDQSLPNGKRGEVYEVMGDRVALLLDISENSTDEGEKDEKPTGEAAEPLLYFVQVKNLEHDLDIQAEDCYVAMEALCEVLHSTQPIIVYFPDSSLWLSRAVSKSNRKEFVHKVQEMLDQLSGPLVLICGQNKVETGSKEKEKFTMILPNLGRLAKLESRNQVTNLREKRDSAFLRKKREDDVLRTFNKQVEEDRRIVISRSNINELHKVLEEHELSCLDLLHVNTDGVILTKRKAEKVVGWAKNHYLSSCLLPSIKAERLCVPRGSLEIAILRLREQETISKKPSQNLKNLAKDEYESNFVSAVVPPGEIGVKFDDIGALEEVKRALNELVILPMRRPELFLHGNLLRPCKGILLFGPPGTGKTLLAKALATEAGANFISITGSTLTSKWFGDAEKLTKALFSFASKLSPVIVFVDEVDSLLGARGGSFEHEATRRMRNEFMAAWDGLRSKDSQRILILGATNRPFDLDDAVIRRLPRRIYVDLPDAENRVKILRIFLAKENLEPEFQFEKLANATEGYSGSDLKNLCIAAAYRPVQELLEEEKKVDKNDMVPVLRPLNLDDFIESKAKVGASVAYDATSMNELRKWNDQYGEGGSRRTSPFGF
ncbi:hypothetical protein TEA_004636 [Camellia sinensis var. sinensis]|uniref:AAA+ ATPase domain-containing protein n=1 Tax=Camellia sinensis var. sinensis TaxID=542762 RepID=A0A4S4EZ74_CAMSN|nr:hypothetical protein TEA_004636 [Camellia sinensis var. sinensis]